MKSNSIKNQNGFYTLNSPKQLQSFNSNISNKNWKTSIASSQLFKIQIVQSIYCRNNLFEDINHSVLKNQNVVFKRIKDYIDAKNYLDSVTNINHKVLSNVLKLICPNETNYTYRNININVKTFYKSNIKYWFFCDPNKIKILMENYFKSLNNTNIKQMLPFIYSQLILIHPYENGNGRLARFLQIYYSDKLYKETKEFIPLSIFYRHVRENRIFEHEKIRNYCITNETNNIFEWFQNFTIYSKNQFNFIENEIKKQYINLETTFGPKKIPQDLLFNIYVDINSIPLELIQILDKLSDKQYFVKIGPQYLNLLICTLLSTLKIERGEFNR